MSATIEPSPTKENSEARLPFGRLHRFTPEQYFRMIRLGIITEDDGCELLEGVIVAKRARNPEHVGVARLLFAALSAVVPEGWHVAKGDPFRTGDSVPEPDVFVLRGTIRDYMRKTPEPSDLALVVEVANTTLARDRGRKRRIYARAGIASYWLENLRENRLELYTEPSGPVPKPSYRSVQTFGLDDSVPVVIAGREVGRILVRDIFP